MDLSYDWIAGLATLLLIIATVVIGQRIVFSIPAIARTRELNNAQNKDKWRNKAGKYHHRVKSSQKIGLGVNLVFYIGIMPFLVTLEAQPMYKVVLDVFLIMMIYDFLYYLMHRFLFHGQGKMRQVHAVHHQARQPTYIDAHYVHPLETFMGLGLFFLTIALLAALLGTFQIVTIVALYILYVQLNQINHTKVDLPYFPYRLLTWITVKHHKHHENMHMGNYSTITLLWDKLFGTYE